MIASNSRAPGDIVGDCHAQIEATRVAEQELFRLIDKYGRDDVVAAFGEVQDYVERLTRARIADLPDGTWETTDHVDFDPGGEEGLVTVCVKLTISGDEIEYDLSGSDPAIKSFLNSGAGVAFSGAIASAKTFLPEIPLNSGFYRAIRVDAGPEGTIVNAGWPNAVTGSVSGAYEKIMNAGFELWSQLMPERAMACCFNLEYLLVGGRDARRDDRPFFMWYDWMAGGWGGRNGRDGQDCTSPVFGVGLAVQPFEGQERLTPVLTSQHEIIPDSGGPGKHRGGCGVRKGGELTQVEAAVMSYCCDRARSVTWGIGGGLPSLPHGVWLNRGTDDERFLGANFSGVPVKRGRPLRAPVGRRRRARRPARARPRRGAGGRRRRLRDRPPRGARLRRRGRGGRRRARRVPRRRRRHAQAARRAARRARRRGSTRIPRTSRSRFRDGELDVLDLVRHYGVILDWGSGDVLPRTTEQYRELLQRRSASQWEGG